MFQQSWRLALTVGGLGAVCGAALWSGLGVSGALIVTFGAGLCVVAMSQYTRNATWMAAPVRICDTRRGDDISTMWRDAPRLLAGVPDPVVVVDAIGVDWAPYAAQLDAIFAAPHTQPFVLCNAWVPGAKRTLAALSEAFPAAAAKDESLRTRSPGSFVMDALAVRQATGGHASGTWIIGACTSIDALQAALAVDPAEHGYTPFPAALAGFEHAIGALCLDELHSTLIVRITPGTADGVDRLLEQVRADRPAPDVRFPATLR